MPEVSQRLRGGPGQLMGYSELRVRTLLPQSTQLVNQTLTRRRSLELTVEFDPGDNIRDAEPVKRRGTFHTKSSAARRSASSGARWGVSTASEGTVVVFAKPLSAVGPTWTLVSSVLASMTQYSRTPKDA
jgi:hypothetical protein